MGFVVYFPTGVPLTEIDYSIPIIFGNYDVYQNHVTTYQRCDHNLGGSTQWGPIQEVVC